MKALLFVFTFYAGESAHSLVIEMPTMAGCQAAAVILNEPIKSSSLARKMVVARCAEKR